MSFNFDMNILAVVTVIVLTLRAGYRSKKARNNF